MRVLFDLVHPANSLVFFHSINALKNAGAEVRIVSRHKDVLTSLLDAFGFDHTPISTAGNGRIQLARELVHRDWELWKVARRFRPHVMVGFGGVAISHVGKLTGIPSLSFYDTEHAKLQIRLALPFITEWHVPDTWQGLEAEGRTHRFPGGKQFTYLHPDHFTPSAAIARSAGWDPSRDNFLIRTVLWRAAHDSGRSGLGTERLRELVGTLQAGGGKVHLSAEGELPPDLEHLRFRADAAQFHHLLAHCRAYCGESITIASEAVMLGVPVLLQIDKEYCYVTEQEDAGLILRLRPEDSIPDRVEQLLREGLPDFRQRAKAFVASKSDLNLYILDQIARIGLREGRANLR